MGPLAVLLYRRIVKLKIITDLDVDGEPWNFLKPVLDYYEFYSAKYSQDKKFSEKIFQILGVIPTYRELKKGLRSRMLKENVIYKIVIDVLAHHYTLSEPTNLKVSIF